MIVIEDVVHVGTGWWYFGSLIGSVFSKFWWHVGWGNVIESIQNVLLITCWYESVDRQDNSVIRIRNSTKIFLVKSELYFILFLFWFYHLRLWVLGLHSVSNGPKCPFYKNLKFKNFNIKIEIFISTYCADLSFILDVIFHTTQVQYCMESLVALNAKAHLTISTVSYLLSGALVRPLM